MPTELRRRHQQKTCFHGRRLYYCRDCGGKGICEHSKRRYNCKQCEGGGICEHGALRAYCKPCSGSGICKVHGRRKTYCTAGCGGSSICEHSRVKTQCRECPNMFTGLTSKCEHNNRRATCRICRGSSFCPHDKQKAACNICSGCEHGNIRNTCKQCGIGYCIHGLRRAACKSCSWGRAICHHNLRRYNCRSCNENLPFCQHGFFADYCRQCDRNAQQQRDSSTDVELRKSDELPFRTENSVDFSTVVSKEEFWDSLRRDAAAEQMDGRYEFDPIKKGDITDLFADLPHDCKEAVEKQRRPDKENSLLRKKRQISQKRTQQNNNNNVDNPKVERIKERQHLNDTISSFVRGNTAVNSFSFVSVSHQFSLLLVVMLSPIVMLVFLMRQGKRSKRSHRNPSGM